MKNYLLLVRGSGPGFNQLDDAAKGAHYGEWSEYVKKLNDGGQWVMGNPLDESGRLYCSKREAAEGVVGDADIAVAGYMVVQAESYDAAVEIADGCPALNVDGKMEIRECLEM